MNFQEFCNSLANNQLIVDALPESVDTFGLETRVNAMIAIMENKVNILDKIHVDFIQSAMADMSVVEKKLKQFNDGDVPDYVLIRLSDGLYGKQFNELTICQQNIIKILAVYICISALDN